MRIYTVTLVIALSACAVQSTWTTQSQQWHDRITRGG